MDAVRSPVLDDLKQVVADLERARTRLDQAVEAARAAGYSWRLIGAAAGLPYQTLQRRHARR
jgi:hypothetical protein